jgi:hypothetical protein
MTRSLFHVLVPGAVAFGAFLGTSGAWATPTSRLVYSRSAEADSCPDEQSLRRAVATRIGYDPFFPYATRTIVATMARHGRDFVATVDLVDEGGFSHGARELRAAGDCGELLDAVALAIAIAIDPQSLTQTTPPAPPESEPETPAPKTIPPPPAPTPPSTQPAPPDVIPHAPAAPVSRPDLELTAGAAMSAGFAPGTVAIGLALGAAWRVRVLSLGVEGRVDAPSSEAAPRGGEVSSWLLIGAVVPCIRLGYLFVCALMQGGVSENAGSGVQGARSGSALWLATGGRLGVEFPVGDRVRLRLHGDVVGNLARSTLDLSTKAAWHAPPWAGSAGAGLVFHFP